MGHRRILPTPQRAHLPASYQKAVLPSASSYPMCTPDLGLPAIPEGWPHHLWEADHHRGFPCPGLPALWRGYTPVEQHPAPPAPWKRTRAQKSWNKLGQAMKNLLPFSGSPSKSGNTREEPLGFSAAQLATPTLGGCFTPVEQMPSTASPLQEVPQPRKARTSSARTYKICLHCGAVLPVPAALGMSPLGSQQPS